MKESLTALCEVFAESSETLYKQKGFKLTSTKLMPVCAYIYATSGRKVEPERLQESLKLVKNSGGWMLSGLREAMQAPLACTLAVSDDPAGTMNAASANLEMLKKTFQESKYLGLAAIMLPKMGAAEEFDSKVSKGKAIFDCLKTRRKINPDAHDTLFTIIAAYSDKPVEAIADEVEKIYAELKQMSSGEYAKGCAWILACSNKTSEEKTARLKSLYEALQADKKNNYSNGSEMAVLSALSLFDIDDKTLVDDILDASKLLSTKKHYKGLLSYSRYSRMMHAAMMVTADNMTSELNVLATAAIYLSCFYDYELDQKSTEAGVIASLMPY